jgi:hypothetical protein
MSLYYDPPTLQLFENSQLFNALHSWLLSHANLRNTRNTISSALPTNILWYHLETYGGVSKEAIRLLQSRSEHAHSLSPTQFMNHSLRTLSVCLQRGNATVSLLGQQRLHLKRQHQRLQETRAFAGLRFSHRPLRTISNSRLRRRRLAAQLDADDAFSYSLAAASNSNSRSATSPFAYPVPLLSLPAFIHPPLRTADHLHQSHSHSHSLSRLPPAPASSAQLSCAQTARSCMQRGGWEGGLGAEQMQEMQMEMV